MSKLFRFLITLVVLALVGFGFYYFVSLRQEAATPAGITAGGFSTASDVSPELVSLAQANDEFLRQLESLQGIRLQSEIFSSQVFNKRLIDSSFELQPELRCRRNPFAPIDATDDYRCGETANTTLVPVEEEATSPDQTGASSNENENE